MTLYGTYLETTPNGLIELGFPERNAWSYLDILLTAPLIQDVDVVIAEDQDVQANLNIEISAMIDPPVEMSITIFGTTLKTLPVNVLVQGLVTKTTDLDVSVETVEKRYADLDLAVRDPLPYRYMRLRKDLLTRYFGGTASDANFFEGFDPPNPGALVHNDIGIFDPSHRSLVYITTNAIPLALTFDKYSLPLSGPLVINTVGFRSLVDFRLSGIGPNSSLMFGWFNDQLDPFSSILSGNILAFAFELVDGRVRFRGWWGLTNSALDLGPDLSIPYLSQNFVVEMELIEITAVYTMEFRIFDRDQDLDVPLYSFRLNSSSTPTVDRFSITSLGRRDPLSPTAQPNMSAAFEYVDVEPGTGVLYSVNSTTGLTLAEAKWRPYQDRPPVQLRAFGDNQIFCALSSDGIVSTIESQDTVRVDPSRPVIHVAKLLVDSPAFVPYAVTPPIPKGSLNPGFSGCALIWFATQPGTWTLRINSTSPIDGIEISSGQYNTPGISVTASWDFSDLPGPDGTYDVTLYLTNAAGLSTGKGIGEYLLPFQPKIGSALDISIV